MCGANTRQKQTKNQTLDAVCELITEKTNCDSLLFFLQIYVQTTECVGALCVGVFEFHWLLLLKLREFLHWIDNGGWLSMFNGDW